MWNMNYTKPFKYISEIVECQSISAAAERLHIQQPALSKYLKNVEKEIGGEIFDRSTNPISITEIGKCYLETAQKVIDADNQLQKQIADIHNKNTKIKVGISPSRAPYLLPVIIKEFIKFEPNVQIVIVEGNMSELDCGLAEGKLDLIISLFDEDTKKFEKIDLFTESLYLAVSPVFKSLSFKEAINNLRLISSGRGTVLSDILKCNAENSSLIECQNITTAFELVKADVGAAIVPSYLLDYGATAGVSFIDIPEGVSDNCHRKISIFYRRGQYLSSAEKKFIDCCVSVTKNKVLNIK